MLDKILPSELVDSILQHLPPASHLDFACTCKKIADASQQILRRHQDAHAKFCVASDRDPFTVILLLKSAFGLSDPIPAWHVRSFEVWCERNEWVDWVDPSYVESSESREKDSPPCSHALFGVMTQCFEWLEDYVEGDLEESYQNVFEQVQCGNDGFLKALLLAHCPRLQEVKFITRSQNSDSCLFWLERLMFDCVHAQDCCQERNDEQKWQAASSGWIPSGAWNDSDEETTSVAEEYSMNSSQDVDGNLRHANTSPHSVASPMVYKWPIGLDCLRRVAIGVDSALGLQYDRSKDSTTLFACLLRLPNLETIYFNGLRCIGPDDDSDDEYDDEDRNGSGCAAEQIVPAQCSSVKHIFLDGLDQSETSEFYKAFSRASQGLVTFALRFKGPEGYLLYSDSIVAALSKFQGHSLESLMWYGYDYRTVDGYECSACHVEDLAGFICLKQVSFNIDDLSQSVESAVCQAHMDSDNEGDFIIQYIADAFPTSMETLVLWGNRNNYYLVDERRHLLLERAIIKMIEGERYENLKAIFIQRPGRIAPAQESTWFHDAVAKGKAAGVDVFTSVEGQSVQHSLKFPEPEDEHNLGMRSCSSQRSEGWVLDPFVGQRKWL